MTIEEQLKSEILSKYNSVRAFSSAIAIPYTTLDSVLKRGIKGAGVGTIMKVFSALDLDIESIPDGVLRHKDFTPYSEYSDEEALLIDSYRKLNHAGKAYIQQTMAMAVMAYAEKSNAASGMEAAK